MSEKQKHTAQIILRYLITAGLLLGWATMSAEATDLVEGAADWFSLAFTAVLHGGAIAAILLRYEHARYIALAVFLSDAMLGIYTAAVLTEFSTHTHGISAGAGVVTSVIFAVATYFWTPEEAS